MTYKAPLVAREFQEENLQEICKNLPTCCKDNFCLALRIIISEPWTIHSGDVKSGYSTRKKY